MGTEGGTEHFQTSLSEDVHTAVARALGASCALEIFASGEMIVPGDTFDDVGFQDSGWLSVQEIDASVLNGEFAAEISGFNYTTPADWDGSGRVIVVASGNGAWGGLTTQSSRNFVALQNYQGEKASIKQKVGLVRRGKYMLKYLTASRPPKAGVRSESGNRLRLRIMCPQRGKKFVSDRMPPSDRFQPIIDCFELDETSEIELAFSNISSTSGDRTVFVADVELVPFGGDVEEYALHTGQDISCARYHILRSADQRRGRTEPAEVLLSS